MCPCQRFACDLAVADACLGVGMTGWVFPVRLFHSLLCARFQRRGQRTALTARCVVGLSLLDLVKDLRLCLGQELPGDRVADCSTG